MKKIVIGVIAVAIAFVIGNWIGIRQACGVDCVAGSKAWMVSVPATEFAEVAESGDVTILDIRTPEEYASGHITGAENVDFYKTGAFTKYLDSLDRDKPYLIYCRTGNRSGQALDMMREMRFNNVTDLAGGIVAWQQAGLRVE